MRGLFFLFLIFVPQSQSATLVVPGTFDSRDSFPKCRNIIKYVSRGSHGCGDCWVHTGLQYLRTLLCIEGLEITQALSVFDVLSCSPRRYSRPCKGQNFDAFMSIAERTVTTGTNSVGEKNVLHACKSYPFPLCDTRAPDVDPNCPNLESADGRYDILRYPCEKKCDHESLKYEKLQYGGGKIAKKLEKKNIVNEMKKAVMTNGSIITSYYVKDHFLKIKNEGLLYVTKTEKNYNVRSRNHYLLIIGWKLDRKHGEVWIVKNSNAGSSFGDEGVFYVKLGSNVNGIEEEVIIMVSAKTKETDKSSGTTSASTSIRSSTKTATSSSEFSLPSTSGTTTSRTSTSHSTLSTSRSSQRDNTSTSTPTEDTIINMKQKKDRSHRSAKISRKNKKNSKKAEKIKRSKKDVEDSDLEKFLPEFASKNAIVDVELFNIGEKAKKEMEKTVTFSVSLDLGTVKETKFPDEFKTFHAKENKLSSATAIPLTANEEELNTSTPSASFTKVAMTEIKTRTTESDITVTTRNSLLPEQKSSILNTATFMTPEVSTRPLPVLAAVTVAPVPVMPAAAQTAPVIRAPMLPASAAPVFPSAMSADLMADSSSPVSVTPPAASTTPLANGVDPTTLQEIKGEKLSSDTVSMSMEEVLTFIVLKLVSHYYYYIPSLVFERIFEVVIAVVRIVIVPWIYNMSNDWLIVLLYFILNKSPYSLLSFAGWFIITSSSVEALQLTPIGRVETNTSLTDEMEGSLVAKTDSILYTMNIAFLLLAAAMLLVFVALIVQVVTAFFRYIAAKKEKKAPPPTQVVVKKEKKHRSHRSHRSAKISRKNKKNSKKAEKIKRSKKEVEDSDLEKFLPEFGSKNAIVDVELFNIGEKAKKEMEKTVTFSVSLDLGTVKETKFPDEFKTFPAKENKFSSATAIPLTANEEELNTSTPSASFTKVAMTEIKTRTTESDITVTTRNWLLPEQKSSILNTATFMTPEVSTRPLPVLAAVTVAPVPVMPAAAQTAPVIRAPMLPASAAPAFPSPALAHVPVPVENSSGLLPQATAVPSPVGTPHAINDDKPSSVYPFASEVPKPNTSSVNLNLPMDHAGKSAISGRSGEKMKTAKNKWQKSHKSTRTRRGSKKNTINSAYFEPKI